MIIFENKGLLDKRSITTFGVSSKENDNAIGFFGTGLKYAIAILLRTGHEITIYIDGEPLEMGTLRETIRVDEFDTVTMNGDRLGFTTELGKTWEVWQAYRELYCNCTDEHGTIYESRTLPCLERKTVVAVRGSDVARAHSRRDDIILSRDDYISSNTFADALLGSTSGVFYKGILAYQLPKPALYTYNLRTSVELTEDRTIKSEWDIRYAMAHTIANSNDANLVKAAVTAEEEYYESEISYSGQTPSKTFLSTVRECVRNNPLKVNQTAMRLAEIKKEDLLPKEQGGILNDIDAARLKSSIDFCRDIGINVDSYPIIVVDRIDDGVMGMAHESKIYLTRLAFNQGTKAVAGTLIEEYLHLSQGFSDGSRAMQNYLVDLVVSVGEQSVGRPL